MSLHIWCLHISKRYLIKSSSEKKIRQNYFDGCKIEIFQICALKRETAAKKKKKDCFVFLRTLGERNAGKEAFKI